jgi:hypothetical protein
MLNYKIVDLPRIAIIGKEGLCTKERNAVQDAKIRKNGRKWRGNACHTGGERI